jgi:hypothetical protein
MMNVCLFSCVGYPASKAHHFCAVFHCHLWPVWLYPMFTHYFINVRI